jgi:hypothetical protein
MWAVTAPHGQNPSAPLCAPLCLSSLALALLPMSYQHAWMQRGMWHVGICWPTWACVWQHGRAWCVWQHGFANPVRRTRVALGQSLTHYGTGMRAAQGLLEAGASVLTEDGAGGTALRWAVEAGRTDMIQLLAKYQ